MGFESIKDERTRRLAETLKSSGMACSESEAIRMAEEMSFTANKIQKSFDNQDNKESVDSTNVDEVVSKISKDESVKKFKDEDVVPEKLDVESLDSESLYKAQESVIKSSFGVDLNSYKTVKELMDEDAEDIYSVADDSDVKPKMTFIQPEEKEEVFIDENKPIVFDPEQPSPLPFNGSPDGKHTFDPEYPSPLHFNGSPDGKYTFDPEDPSPMEIQKIASKPAPEIRVKPEEKVDDKKKSVDDSPESKIDLSDVFNFTKRK
ncbi:MAG: hypothetical protein KKF89_02420 [Nanoarchaeota archaeon]|nr:hypothetical protein [Nanoarchaeota archaeon]MBU1854548.1 hypothetical protein [Nanoarchaeota archaeon]